MTPWELLIATGVYISVALRYGQSDNPGMALVFAAYALANAGFIWAAIRHG